MLSQIIYSGLPMAGSANMTSVVTSCGSQKGFGFRTWTRRTETHPGGRCREDCSNLRFARFLDVLKKVSFSFPLRFHSSPFAVRHDLAICDGRLCSGLTSVLIPNS